MRARGRYYARLLFRLDFVNNKTASQSQCGDGGAEYSVEKENSRRIMSTLFRVEGGE